MARIKIYDLDSEIDPADKVIGSDGKPGATYGNTKNYSFQQLASYFAGGEGAAGASAYQIWLDNGNTGTEQDFLNSLVGAAGAQGPAGAAGSDGADGINGTNGVDGQDGAQGEPGADGTSINIQGIKETVGDLPASGSAGDLWIINTAGGGANAGDGYVWTQEGNWLNIGPLRGPQGIQGVPGQDGADGADGTNGSDGGQGPQGLQGIQGLQGLQGIPGADGTPGSIIEEVTGVVPVLVDGSYNNYNITHPINVLLSQCTMYKMELRDSNGASFEPKRYLVNFKLALQVEPTEAAKSDPNTNLFKSGGSINVKLTNLGSGGAELSIPSSEGNFYYDAFVNYKASSKIYTPLEFHANLRNSGTAYDTFGLALKTLNLNVWGVDINQTFTASTFINSSSDTPLRIDISGTFKAIDTSQP